jgi:hypothetical protein
MRDFWKIISAAVVIGISVLLIQRSCHDEHGIDDPDRSGGIGGVTAMVQPQAARPEVASTPQARATPEAASTPASVTARNQTSRSDKEAVQQYQRAYEEWQKSSNSASGSVDSASQASSTVANAAKRTTEQIQGTWILFDPNNTTLELTIGNDSGFVRSYRSEIERNQSVERKVKVVAAGASIWVVASDADDLTSRFTGRETIMLAFSFEPSGSPRVLRLNAANKEPAQLRVVSHTK